ncbi:MAG: enoyl-CoA hydratase-related protein, partial [Pseudomonadota bacterium]
MTQAFRLDQDGHVATLTLSNPERRNALAPALWEDLPDAIEALDRSGTCRALVIQSEGPHFCSGIDLSLLGSTRPDNLGAAQGLDVYAVIKRMQRTFTALEEARFPVIAAIQGGCIGAGVDLATACDLRMCTDDAYFTVYEIVMGMTADVGTFPRILNL